MTAIVPEADVTTIDHLDFTPACHLVMRRRANSAERVPCTEPATWYIVMRHHCIPDEPQHLFICERHHDRLVAQGAWLCPQCGERFIALPHVIRTERIR